LKITEPIENLSALTLFFYGTSYKLAPAAGYKLAPAAGGFPQGNSLKEAIHGTHRVGKGISAQASHRTVRDSLPSYGSSNLLFV